MNNDHHPPFPPHHYANQNWKPRKTTTNDFQIIKIRDRETLLDYFGSRTNHQVDIKIISWLGEGAFCSVYHLHGKNASAPNKIFSFAGKMISEKTKHKSHAKQSLLTEYSILHDLNHKNVIKIFGYHRENHFVYLPLYDCSLRDLRHDLKTFLLINDSELLIKLLLFQILSGVDYLHDHDIIHRDLACKNILLSTTSQEQVIVNDTKTIIKTICECVIADFGAAIRFSTATKSILTDWVTTPTYAAPEINPFISSGPITKAIDMWSLGCIMADLVTRTEFFNSHRYQSNEKMRSVHFSVLKEKLGLHADKNTNEWTKDNELFQKQFSSLSKSGLDFLSQLLEINPKKRMTAKEALLHPWIAEK
jgi:mitogen-activated protein kinase 1/3